MLLIQLQNNTGQDISADLTELGRTPVAVVCAGVKSILDIPKTIEFLETQGTHGHLAPNASNGVDSGYPKFLASAYLLFD